MHTVHDLRVPVHDLISKCGYLVIATPAWYSGRGRPQRCTARKSASQGLSFLSTKVTSMLTRYSVILPSLTTIF